MMVKQNFYQVLIMLGRNLDLVMLRLSLFFFKIFTIVMLINCLLIKKISVWVCMPALDFTRHNL